MDYDVVVIGAGVVGLACAYKLSSENLSCLVIERHTSFGRETSSRNSEVIHAGIYYPKDSLKAKLCVPGNISIYEWCGQNNIPHNRIGKYIIAVNPEEEEELENIYNRAVANGVIGIRRATADEIKKNEPNVKAYTALFSRDTGIVDSHQLMDSLCESAKQNNCDFAWKHNLTGISKIDDGYLLDILSPDNENCTISATNIINSAGLDSDKVAEMAGINIEEAGYNLHYCRGHYFRLSASKRGLVNHLIYPVPQKNITGLGIHVTLELSGDLKLGPDTQYLNERVQDYNIPTELLPKFHQAVSRYINGIKIEDLSPDQSGIRPKLQADGQPFRDFIINEESGRGLPGFVNLIGIESPGLTSCFEIADMVKKLII